MTWVNALSLRPVKTRVASGIADFDELMERMAEHCFYGKPVDIENAGRLATYLASDASKAVAASTYLMDSGFHSSTLGSFISR